MIKFLFFSLLIATSLCLDIYAQDFATKGDIELGGSISFISTTNVNNGETASNSLSIFSLNSYLGYFIANSFEIGIIPSLTTASYGGSSSTAIGIYLAPSWNFILRSSNIYPFV